MKCNGSTASCNLPLLVSNLTWDIIIYTMGIFSFAVCEMGVALFPHHIFPTSLKTHCPRFFECQPPGDGIRPSSLCLNLWAESLLSQGDSHRLSQIFICFQIKKDLVDWIFHYPHLFSDIYFSV